MDDIPGIDADAPQHAATRLELAMEAGELGMWEWDIATNRMQYSDRARAIYGFPPGVPLTFAIVRDATHPEDLPFTSAQAQRSIDPDIRERRPYEYRVVRPDGSIRWVLAYGQALFEETNGKVRATRYIGTIQDITVRKEMELEIQSAASRLRLALTASHMAVWEIDTKGAVKTSPELNRILGFPEDADPSLDEIHARYVPGELERVQDEARRAVIRGEHVFDLEFQYRWSDSSVRWLWVRAQTPEQTETSGYAAIGVVQDVTRRKEREQHVELLLHELSHRSKNLLAVVQAVTRQTVRSAKSPAEFEKAMIGRVQALASAHDLLLKEDWRGAIVSDVINNQIRAFAEIDPARVSISGPDLLLHSNAAQELSIAVYELATNALKYGALSAPGGRVTISWRVERIGSAARTLRLQWTESGGPPVVEPTRRGFGSTVLERGGEGRGPALEFASGGLRWSREWTEPEFSVR